MQSELLDITIIGCLVLLFGSTYRKRPSRVVRVWLLGWVLILVHFAALLITPSGIVAARIATSISLAALFACGIVFLYAPPREREYSKRELLLVLCVAATGILVCVGLDVCEITSSVASSTAGALVAVTWVTYSLRLPSVSLKCRALLLLSVCATAYWFNWAIVHRVPDLGLSALLTQLFILVGITYIGTVRRISAGTLTVSLGLVAWASVFPTAAFLDHLHLASRIHPEFWNIPKYFVAFGMMLLLLEEEIIVANEAGANLLFQASHDQLTGLRNRGTLERDLQSALQHAGDASKKCALICFDLDRFKHINDSYGHGIGDICLRTASERLSRLDSDRCTSARIGGEEFGVLVRDIHELAEAEAIAQQIESALREPVHADGYLIEVTASIGIAVFPDDGPDPATLWRNADSAMYRAKRTGGNQIVSMSPEILQFTTESNDMEQSLRQALKDDGLELFFQPIVHPDGYIHSVEALVRMHHPRLGLILPDRFIFVAEERGLIVPLGEWVFKAVCLQLANWQQRNMPPMPIAMNISALQITSPKFAFDTLESLSKFGIDPSLVSMEITETAMLRNVSEASRQIDMLAAAGISFSVDDFGMGYSSFGQLDKLDVDYLKIDRSFVARMCNADETRPMVAAIISMAHGLGLQVVAEGVEDQRSMDHLCDMGCDLFQGFFFGHPLASCEVEKLLIRNKDREATSSRTNA